MAASAVDADVDADARPTPTPTPAPSASLLALSLAGALLVSAAYVALLYVPPFRSRLPRDHPQTIARRAAACAVACALAPLPLLLLLLLPLSSSDGAPPDASRLLGLSPPRPWRAFLAPPALAFLPYLPSACDWLIIKARSLLSRRHRRRKGPLPLTPTPPTTPPPAAARRGRSAAVLARDLLAAPLTEEWAFRACLLPLLVLGGVPSGLAPWIAPLFFSLAHAHHHFVPPLPSAPSSANGGDVQRRRRTAPSSPSRRQRVTLLFVQLSYTYAFGLYASLMLVATGSLPGVALAHALCNALGLPGGGGGGGGGGGSAGGRAGAVALAAATAAGVAAMVAAMAVPDGALDAGRWFGGGLFSGD